MEKKKIQAKPKLSAEAQEQMLQRLQQNTENTVNLQQVNDFTVNLQQKVENTPKVLENTASAVNGNSRLVEKINTVQIQQITESAVKEITNTANVERSGKIQRITVDMPIEIYEKMKDEVDDNGQTIKGFIVNLVKNHFQKNKA